MDIATAVDHVPLPVQHVASWTSVGGALSAFFGIVQGPLAAGASALSIVWLGLQIYAWFERRFKRKE